MVSKNAVLSYIPTIIDEAKILSALKNLSIKAKKIADTVSAFEEKKERV